MADENRGLGKPDIGPLYTKFTEIREDGSVPSPLLMFSDVSITSQFKVSLHLASYGANNRITKNTSLGLNKWLDGCNLLNTNSKITRYDFACSQASLPGSTILSSNETGSYQGITEEFPVRRAYSAFDITLYVDRDYSTLRLFEEWMNFINPINTRGGPAGGTKDGYGNAKNSNDYFRLRYPAEYRKIISVTKFERDFIEVNKNREDRIVRNDKINTITYRMIDAYPYNISPVPLTYEGSSVASVVVSFKYSRYAVESSVKKEVYK